MLFPFFLFSQINEVNLNRTNLQIEALEREDAMVSKLGDKTYRFGASYKQLFTIKDFSKVGDEEYCLKVICQDAYSINLIFNVFNIKDNAILKLQYGNGQEEVFTSKDVKKTKVLATYPIATNKLLITYKGSLNEDSNEDPFVLSHIIYGYKPLRSLQEKAVLCIPNVNCPSGANYQDVKRSVVEILFGTNSYKGTGTLINNTSGDQKPYLLTALHVSGLGASTVFRFNYEGIDCFEQIGPTNQYLVGGVVKSSNACSDFQLLELDDTIPSSFNAFYAGWDHSGLIPSQTVCIHHPSGAVKKISKDNDPPQIYGYGVAGNDHWHILEWDEGVTKTGSSGAPLFDNNKRVIGQLHGGLSNCGGINTITTNDYYGRLYTSWTCGNNPSNNISGWLDPLNTGSNTLDGVDANYSNLLNYNLGITGHNIPQNICETYTNIKLNVKNYGNALVNAFTVKISLNGNFVNTINWIGTLPSFSTIEVPLGNIHNGFVSGSFTFEIIDINGQNDQSPTDNTINVAFEKVYAEGFNLEIKTDAYPEESSFIVLDTGSNIVFSMPLLTLPTNTSSFFDICLPVGCYKIVMKDSGGNGLCCGSGRGYYKITSKVTNTIVIQDSAFFFTDTASICPFVGIAETSFENLNIYPNPASSIINIVMPNYYFYNVKMYNVLGQLLINENQINTINTNSLSDGIYYISVSTTTKTIVKKVLIQK